MIYTASIHKLLITTILLNKVVQTFSIPFFLNFDNLYLDNKFTYLAHTWVFTQGSSTTGVVTHLFKSYQNLFIYLHLCNSSIAHDSVTTQFLSLM